MSECAENARALNRYISYNNDENTVIVRNGRMEIVIETKPYLNPRRIKDTKSTRMYADASYMWPAGMKPLLMEKPLICENAVSFSASWKSLKISYSLTLADEADTIAESIKLTNISDTVYDTSLFMCGFAKIAVSQESWDESVRASHFCAIPFRYHNETGELCDYSVEDMDCKTNWYSTMRNPFYCRKETKIWGSEAWGWYSDGSAMLIAKYNPDAMEWSLAELVNKKDKVLRFGGAGRWKLGDPEGSAVLKPGESFTFGETYYQIMDGDWKQAYAAFRRYMQRKGCVLPEKYNPSVNWNELYNNKFWGMSSEGAKYAPELLAEYYGLDDIMDEAKAAYDMGCECLYLDPGFDDAFGSTIWDEARLGTQRSFAEMIRRKYSLKLALHTPLAPWNNPDGYPEEMIQRDANGRKLPYLCCASDGYVKLKAERIRNLCRDGASHLLFDGAWFEFQCWDTSHGHSVPSTHQEHTDAILKIIQAVHMEYPDVIIELHDPITGPGTPRYTPCYYMYGKPGGPDEVWAFEYMNEPLEDILSHRAFSLYYYNLAYSIPLYLHIDLRKDNENALMLWWYMSTCRHIGMGGTHSDSRAYEVQKQAMKTYLKNERFFKKGVFYGLDETTHIHVLPDINEFVVNCFNLDDSEISKCICIDITGIGLSGDSVDINGNVYSVTEGCVSVAVAIHPKGHVLLKGKVSGK